MFGDIGFFEILIVSVIALVVLGPERLPKVARSVGRWVGKAKSTVAAFKADIDRELQLEEMKAKLEEHARQLQQASDDIKQEAKTIASTTDASESTPEQQPTINSDNKASLDDQQAGDHYYEPLPDEPLPDEPLPDEPLPDEPLPDNTIAAADSSASTNSDISKH